MIFHHIGIATENIEKTISFVEANFSIVQVSEIVFDPLQEVHLCMLTTSDGTNIELVSGKAINRFVENRQFLYHTCWEVDNIQNSIESLYNNGAMLISEPKEAILFDYRKVAFMHSELGIIELLEKEVSAF